MDLVIFCPLVLAVFTALTPGGIFWGEVLRVCFRFESSKQEQLVRENSLFVFVDLTYSKLQFYLTPEMLDQFLIKFFRV